MELICSHCHAPIPDRNINVQTDLAKCPVCETVHRSSKLMSRKEWEQVSALYPPAGSKIDIYELDNGDVEIFLPPKGWNGGTIFLAAFATFWLSFVAVWTTFAAIGTIFMALFSIPFWMVGFGMAFSVMNSIWEKQVIRVEEDSLLLRKNRPLLSKNIRLAFSEISHIGRKEVDMRNYITDWNKFNSFTLSQNDLNSSGDKTTAEVPTLQSGLNVYPFFEYISKEEALWLSFTLKDLIKERQSGRSRESRQESLLDDSFELPELLDDLDEDFDAPENLTR